MDTEIRPASLISEKVCRRVHFIGIIGITIGIIAGKYINYDGDIDDEEELLDWLTLPDNMEMTDHIERVNRKMFQKIRQTSDYLAVFFCKHATLIKTSKLYDGIFFFSYS